MTMLVTLQAVSDRLRRDTTDDDADLVGIIEEASSLVLNYLGAGADMLRDSDGNLIVDSDDIVENVPAAIRGAAIWLAAWMYRNRDADDEKIFTQGFLPAPVTAMLYPLRDPVFS